MATINSKLHEWGYLDFGGKTDLALNMIYHEGEVHRDKSSSLDAYAWYLYREDDMRTQ